jgi:hypothetical protein
MSCLMQAHVPHFAANGLAISEREIIVFSWALILSLLVTNTNVSTSFHISYNNVQHRKTKTLYEIFSILPYELITFLIPALHIKMQLF